MYVFACQILAFWKRFWVFCWYKFQTFSWISSLYLVKQTKILFSFGHLPLELQQISFAWLIIQNRNFKLKEKSLKITTTYLAACWQSSTNNAYFCLPAIPDVGFWVLWPTWKKGISPVATHLKCVQQAAPFSFLCISILHCS